MSRVLYIVYALALLGAATFADYRGWGLVSPTTLHNVPKSVRDNPGSYRSLYRASPRYFGGK